MANIRFVKVPNDNRIRSFPNVVSVSDNIKTPAELVCGSGENKENNLFHITTPKRNINNNNSNKSTDLVIKNQENLYLPSDNGTHGSNSITCAENINYTLFSSELQENRKYSPKYQADVDDHEWLNSNFNSMFISDEERNSNVMSNPGIIDTHLEMFCEYNNEILRGESSDEVNDNIADFLTEIQDIKDDTYSEHGQWWKNNPNKMDKTNHDENKIYTRLDTASDDDFSDVLDEEVECLPEISSQGNARFSGIFQQTQEEEDKKHSKKLLKSLPSSQPQNHHTPFSLDSDTVGRYIKRYRPIHRSISDAGVVDSKVSSFFRSVNEAKYYEFDEEEPLHLDEMTISSGETDNSTNLIEDAKLPTKIAWEVRLDSHSSTNTQDNNSDNQIPPLSGKSSTSNNDGHFMMSRSLSGDSMVSERLRIRRCALADPGNMIMRQEVREKIEREVEKRRSSMVRKISQFFNVHLGLNKEEDLI